MAPTPAYPSPRTVYSNSQSPEITTAAPQVLPYLGDLTINSPNHYLNHEKRPTSMPAQTVSFRAEDRDDLGPLSPDPKRRRFANEHPGRANGGGTRFVTVAGHHVAAGPGTPYPFNGHGAPMPPNPIKHIRIITQVCNFVARVCRACAV